MLTNQKPFQAILFDLDGTLLDTAMDIIDAINDVFENYGHERLEFEATRAYVGKGVAPVIKKLFDVEKSDPLYAELVQAIFKRYEETMHNNTAPFAGIELLIQTLDERQIPWGIVTNKPTLHARKSVNSFAFLNNAACIVCGDTLEKAKPHPEPLWHASEIMKIEPVKTLYVGDTEVDMLAAQTANMKTMLALYGYRMPDADWREWKPDYVMEHPEQLIKLLGETQ